MTTIISTIRFLNLSPEECLQVYPSVEINAGELYATASLLTENAYFGKAITHLILGAEEYIKALCLLLDGYGFEIRKIEGVSGIFKNHLPRHHILRDSYSVWMIAKHFFSINAASSRKNLLGNILKAGLSVLPAISNYEWWQQADKLKQQGLYADYQNGLILPSSLAREDYNKALRHTKGIPTEFQTFKQRLQQMNVDDIALYRELFREAEFETLIAESISRLS